MSDGTLYIGTKRYSSWSLRPWLVLTEAGRIALDHADAIFRTAEDLAAVMRETGNVRRALRIGALATLSRNFQMEFLVKHLQNHLKD